jgi:hypothetical protein
LSVTLVAYGVLILGVANLTRLAQALEGWSFLASVLPISPLYLALTGLGWGVVFLAAAWGLWLGRRWAPRYTQGAALAFAAYYWIDRLFVADAAATASSVPFAAVLTALILLFIFWAFSRPKVKAFFGASHDPGPENQTTT